MFKDNIVDVVQHLTHIHFANMQELVFVVLEVLK